MRAFGRMRSVPVPAVDPAQQVRNDLRAFFGPRYDEYLRIYQKMRAAGPQRRRVFSGWSWPVFFGSFVWFFYRKMYIWGALVALVPVVVHFLFGDTGLSLVSGIVFARLAKSQYVNSALGRIAQADALGLADAEREAYLRRAGGVSPLAGTLAGVIYVSALALVAIGHLAANGHAT